MDYSFYFLFYVCECKQTMSTLKERLDLLFKEKQIQATNEVCEENMRKQIETEYKSQVDCVNEKFILLQQQLENIKKEIIIEKKEKGECDMDEQNKALNVVDAFSHQLDSLRKLVDQNSTDLQSSSTEVSKLNVTTKQHEKQLISMSEEISTIYRLKEEMDKLRISVGQMGTSDKIKELEETFTFAFGEIYEQIAKISFYDAKFNSLQETTNAQLKQFETKLEILKEENENLDKQIKEFVANTSNVVSVINSRMSQKMDEFSNRINMLRAGICSDIFERLEGMERRIDAINEGKDEDLRSGSAGWQTFTIDNHSFENPYHLLRSKYLVLNVENSVGYCSMFVPPNTSYRCTIYACCPNHKIFIMNDPEIKESRVVLPNGKELIELSNNAAITLEYAIEQGWRPCNYTNNVRFVDNTDEFVVV